MKEDVGVQKEWQGKVAEYKQLVERGEFTAAHQVAEHCLTFAENALGADDPIVCMSLVNLGSSFTNLKQLDQALEHFDGAIKKMEQIGKANHTITGEALVGKASVRVEQNEFSQAVELYEEALRVFEECGFTPQDTVAETCIVFAETCLLNNDSEKAIVAFGQALNIFELAVGSQYGSKRAALNYRLAQVHFEDGDLNAAQACLKRVVSALVYLESDSGDLYGESLTFLGYVLLRQEEFAEVADYLKKAIAWYQERYGEADRRSVQPLCGLAQLCAATNEPTEAESHYKHALQILEAEQGLEHLDVAEVLAHLGELYLNNPKRFESAAACFKRVQAIYLKELGREHPIYLDALWNYAVALEREDNFTEAAVAMRRVIACFEKTQKEDPLLIINCLEKLGMIYHRSSQCKEEEEVFLRVLELRQEHFGDGALVADGYCQLGACYFRHDQKHQARKFLDKALELREAQHGNEDSAIVRYRSEFEARLVEWGSSKPKSDGDVTHLNIPGIVISAKQIGDPDNEAKAHLYCSALLFLEEGKLDWAETFLNQLLNACLTDQPVSKLINAKLEEVRQKMVEVHKGQEDTAQATKA
ncbi:tetratricopeptide repeat protein [Oligoflexia bacterium]|nr:tetratricopeptide repeat protein [Oligoflexia bacterium]